MIYTSKENKKIKELKKLKEKKYRDKTNTYIVETKHLVEEAYKTGTLKELLLEENTNYNLDVETNYLTKNIIKEISSLNTPPNILGLCTKKQGKIEGNILILDDIQDPGNLGTIIRSAVAFNIKTIVLSKKCVDVYGPKVLRATEGMIFHINIIIEDIEKIIQEIHKLNYKIIGTKVTDGKDVKTLEKNEKFAIIMGNEGNGVHKNILDLCDEYIYIDMNKQCESLNVAITTSIILYELSR